jgi:hypothetical protein
LQHFYSVHVSNVPTISISPNIWIYRDRIGEPYVRLFNWNPDNDSYNNHIRHDIVNNTEECYYLIYEVCALAFGALTNLPVKGTPEYQTVVFNIYDPNHFSYSHSTEIGRYWSQQLFVHDYYHIAKQFVMEMQQMRLIHYYAH